MPEAFRELTSEQQQRLGEIVAEYFSAGVTAARQEIKGRNPDLADVLDSVFGGLDVWNAIAPSSLLSWASAAPANRHQDLAAGGPEHLQPGCIVIPSMDSRLAGGFRVVEKCPAGGSGVVYRARLPQEVHGSPDIALKLLVRGDALDVSKRLRDAQVLKGLDHPNLVRVYAVGESIGLGPFVATEFVEGCNLGEWLQEHGATDERKAAELACALAVALEAAHKKGVVHCDLKPQNVFGCRGDSPMPGELKIGDFGLARYVPETGGPPVNPAGLATGGTVGYMAPEQYWGEYDPRSDVYALGALMLCLILTTKGTRVHFLQEFQTEALKNLLRPHTQELSSARRREHIRETFRLNGLFDQGDSVDDPQLRRIVTKCLAFGPDGRYQTAADLAEDLTLWLDHKPIRHAAYAYGSLELLGMLIKRCREHGDVEDHSKLWGLGCLVIGPTAILFSSLCTGLVMLGQDPDWTRRWTASIFVSVWLGVFAVAIWGTRGGRPTVQLFGYTLIFYIAQEFLRSVVVPDRNLADAVQFLITGMYFAYIGMSSRHWGVFLYLGALVIALSWPVTLAARQPWFDPVAPALLGATQGLILIAFGISYLRPGAMLRQEIARKPSRPASS